MAKPSLQVEKWIDALEESRQTCCKRFVIALILIADLFFHKRLKSETPNRHLKTHQGIFRFVTFNLCPVPNNLAEENRKGKPVILMSSYLVK